MWPWLGSARWPWNVDRNGVAPAKQAAGATAARFDDLTQHHLLNRLTAIRAAAEILASYPDLAAEDRSEFLAVIEEETVELHRAIGGDSAQPAPAH